MEFSKKYQDYLDIINQELNNIIKVPNLPQKSVFEAMEYGLMAGGKRIRPVICVAVADMLNGNLKDAVKVGAAIECIHNYSLIHDDLPCMDNDDFRRGRPTCHKVFKESIALLAGDGLLNLSFELLSDTTRYSNLTPTDILSIIREISYSSGCYGMIGGQVIDLESENKSDLTLDELCGLHSRKTGELIKVSAICGCICGGILDKNDEKYKKIIEFSSKLGLAFQVKDDILDVIGDEIMLGKPVGSDLESNKNTFVSLMGIERAEEELERLTTEAKSALDDIDNNDFLIELADYLLKREY